VLPFLFYRLIVSHLVSVFVVRWLGGSFAKLGFSEGLYGFANEPPDALAIYLFFISTLLRMVSVKREYYSTPHSLDHEYYFLS